MKTLTITIEKGGTGKSLIATQFAFFARHFFGLRVAVIDLDQQQQTAETLVRSGKARKAEVSSADFFTQKTADVLRGSQFQDFTVFGADHRSLVSVQSNTHQDAAKDFFRASVNALSDHFDLAVIDTNPNDDIRSQAALIACTHLVSPMQISSECLAGMRILIERINGAIPKNPDLAHGFIGVLANMYQQTDYQKKGIDGFIAQLGNFMVQTWKYSFIKENGELKHDEAGNLMMCRHPEFCVLKLHDVFKIAQDKACPLWELPNSADAFREMKKAFFTIIEQMHLGTNPHSKPTDADFELFRRVSQKLGKYAGLAVRQYWMTPSPVYMPGILPTDAQALAALRAKIPLSALHLSLAEELPEV